MKKEEKYIEYQLKGSALMADDRNSCELKTHVWNLFRDDPRTPDFICKKCHVVCRYYGQFKKV